MGKRQSSLINRFSQQLSPAGAPSGARVWAGRLTVFTLVARVEEHYSAGASHVCIQAMNPEHPNRPDLNLLERLAPGFVHPADQGELGEKINFVPSREVEIIKSQSASPSTRLMFHNDATGIKTVSAYKPTS